MKQLLIIPLVLILPILLTADEPTANKSILGTWKYTLIEFKGKELPIHKGDQLVFTKDKIKWRWLGKDHEHSYIEKKVNGVRAFEAWYLDGSDYCKGIFKFDGEKLIICDRLSAEGYPKSFSSKNATLLHLSKVKTSTAKNE